MGDAIRSVRIKVGEGIAGIVARTGQTVRVRDAYRDKRFTRAYDELPSYRTQSILAAPMKNHLGRTIGVIHVLNKKNHREFTANDEVLLNALVDRSRRFHRQQPALFVGHAEEHAAPGDQRKARAGRAPPEAHVRARERDEPRQVAGRARARSAARVRRGVRGEFGRGSLVRAEEQGARAARVAGGRAGPSARRTSPRRKRRVGQQCVARPRDAADSDDSCSTRSASEQPLPGGPLGFSLTSRWPSRSKVKTATSARWRSCNKSDGRSFSPEDTELVRLIAANFCTAINLFRSRIQREREERLSTIGSLLSNIMHDLKGPMAVINGYVQMLTQAEDNSARKQYAELVMKQFDTIAAMQREVLEFARGERRLLVRKVYLGQFFEELGTQLEREFDRSKVELVLELAHRGTARFDQNKIARVMHNLVRNAVEAMGSKGGKITLRVRRLVRTVKEDAPDPSGAASSSKYPTPAPVSPKRSKCAFFNRSSPPAKRGAPDSALRSSRKSSRSTRGPSTCARAAPGRRSPSRSRRMIRKPKTALARTSSPAKRRSVAARVLASYVLVIMAFAVTAFWSVVSERRAAQEAELLTTGYVPLKFSIERALEAQNLVSAELNHITEAKNPSDARSWIETERRVRPKTFAEIRAVTRGFGSSADSAAQSFGLDLVREANDIEKFLQADAERFSRLFGAMSSGDSETAERTQNELVSYEVDGARRIRELRDRVDREMDELVAAARARERLSIGVLIGLSALTLAVGIGVSLYARRVLRPLKAVTDRAKAVARGDLTPRRVIASPDEIGELAATFEGMVTAIARANADLVQAERLAAIGKMAAHVTHEIRNPLSSMGLNIELLEEELATRTDLGEAQQLVRAVKGEVERLADLSEEYLRVARRPKPQLVRESLADLVREVVEFVRLELAKAHVVCHVELLEPLPSIALDEAQIRQALLNLIRNAREAMQPNGGELWLRVRAAGDGSGVELVVDDDGSGIVDEAREKVFDPFFTTKERGTGLGLAVTRQIVEAHGGTIGCEPRTPQGHALFHSPAAARRKLDRANERCSKDPHETSRRPQLRHTPPHGNDRGLPSPFRGLGALSRGRDGRALHRFDRRDRARSFSGKGNGWLTAEYQMHPRSNPPDARPRRARQSAERAHAGNPAPHRSRAPRRGRHESARRAHHHHRLRRARGRRRHAHRFDHGRLRGARARARQAHRGKACSTDRCSATPSPPSAWDSSNRASRSISSTSRTARPRRSQPGRHRAARDHRGARNGGGRTDGP